VTEARVVNSRVHSFGFVSFSNEEEAQAALVGMNGKILQGGELKVELAASEPKKRAPRTREAGDAAPKAGRTKERAERAERSAAEKSAAAALAGTINGVAVSPTPFNSPPRIPLN